MDDQSGNSNSNREALRIIALDCDHTCAYNLISAAIDGKVNKEERELRLGKIVSFLQGIGNGCYWHLS